MAPDDGKKRRDRDSTQPRLSSNPADGSSSRTAPRLPVSDPRLGGDDSSQIPTWNQPHRVRDTTQNDRGHQGSMSLGGTAPSSAPLLTTGSSRHALPPIGRDTTVPSAPWGAPLPSSANDSGFPHAPPLSGGGSGGRHVPSTSLADAFDTLTIDPSRSIGPIGRPNVPTLGDSWRANPEPDDSRFPQRRPVRANDDEFPSRYDPFDPSSGRNNPSMQSDSRRHHPPDDSRSTQRRPIRASDDEYPRGYDPRDSPGRPDGASERDQYSRPRDPNVTGKVRMSSNAKPYTGIGPVSIVWVGRWSSGTSEYVEYRDQKLALKTFNGTCPRAPETLVNNLRNEVRRWVSFEHEYIVPFIGICWDSVGGPMVDAPVLVTPYYSDGNIRDYLKQYSITPAERIELIHQIASGLRYLHDMQYVHGNLKGKNILIDEDGCARIGDYGLAPLLGSNRYSQIIRSSPQWTAPELITSDQRPTPTTASDIWAFGMVVLEVMTGGDPWHSISDTAVLLRVASGAQPQQQNYPNIGPDIWAVLRRCWDAEPRRRPRISRVKQDLPQPSTVVYSRR